MKANNGSGNTPERDNWQTPQKLWDKLNIQYKFTRDCCADEAGLNSKCNVWSYRFEDEIDMWTTDIAWMNPPFSKASEMFKHFFKVVNKGIAIYRCDNIETKIWQDIILKGADWVFIPKGRISYEGKEGKGSRFPSALIGKGVPVPNLKNGIILGVIKDEL